MQTRKITIQLDATHTLMVKANLFDEEDGIELDRLLRIDPSNLALELCTFPIILNQLGLMQADANQRVNLAKLEVEVLEAQLAEKLRGDAEEGGGKALSNEKVKEAIGRNPQYQVKKKIYFKRIKESEYLNSLYWSARSKDEKLTKMIGSDIRAGDIGEAIMESKLKKFNYLDIAVLRTSK